MTELSVVGVVAGVVAALTAVLALLWQVLTHMLTRRRVVVSSAYSIPVYDVADGGHFRGDDQITITVSNVGDSRITVTGFGVRMGRSRSAKNMVVVRPHAISFPLPAVGEPGGVPVQVAVPVDELRRAHAEQRIKYRHMRPWVRLGDNRQVFSRNAVPLK